MYGDKAGAETLGARIVLIAARLVDRPFSAEFSFDRHDGNAIRGSRAVPTSLADKVVDKNAFGRVGKTAALAAPPLLGGASLVIDDCSNPGELAQLALDGIEIIAVPHCRSRRKIVAGSIILRLFGHDHDTPYPP